MSILYVLFMLVLFLVLAVIFIVAITMQSVWQMARGVSLTRVDPAQDSRAAKAEQQHAEWAYRQGFDTYLGSYLIRLGTDCYIAAWQHRQRPTYFCVYYTANRFLFDFATIFSENRGLTTGSTKDGQFLPKPPGDYIQTFSGLSLDEQFNQHAVSEHYLMTAGRLQLLSVPWTFEEAVLESIKMQAAYIQSLSMWPMRAPYWFFIRKGRLHNKSIEELHNAGMAPLPHEPGFQEFVYRG